MKLSTRNYSISQIDQEQIVNGRSKRLVGNILMAGLILGILAVALLSAQSALAAGGVADEPCIRCVSGTSAAWYSGMPSLATYYAAKTETSLAAEASLAADQDSVTADAAWYSSMPSLAAYYAAKTETSLAAEASLAADQDSVTADAAWYSSMPSLAAYYAAKTEASLAANAALR